MAPGGKFYGVKAFNPRLILTQMAVLQCTWYLIFVVINQCWSIYAGVPMSVSPLFRGNTYTFSTSRGTGIIISLWISAIAMAFVLPSTVERMKLCLDFVSTYHIIHVVATLIMNGGFLPSYGYWFAHIVAAAISVILGEYLCMRQETQTISLSPNSKSSREKSTNRNNSGLPV